MRCADLMSLLRNLGLAVCVLATPFGKLAFAQDASSSGLSIELSSAESLEAGCRLSFLAQNNLDHALEQVVFEAVLFDADGRVAQMTLLDFKSLPMNRPRVRQFQFGGKSCGDISRILFNGAATCTGADPLICEQTLSVSSRTDMELLG